jgi:hypothetical protein
MGIKNVEMGCARCGAVTPHTLRTPNHLLHLLLTVFTAGLWIVVWILVSLGKPKATCERCKAGVPPVAAAMLVLIAACGQSSSGAIDAPGVVDATKIVAPCGDMQTEPDVDAPVKVFTNYTLSWTGHTDGGFYPRPSPAGWPLISGNGGSVEMVSAPPTNMHVDFNGAWDGRCAFINGRYSVDSTISWFYNPFYVCADAAGVHGSITFCYDSTRPIVTWDFVGVPQ